MVDEGMAMGGEEGVGGGDMKGQSTLETREGCWSASRQSSRNEGRKMLKSRCKSRGIPIQCSRFNCVHGMLLMSFDQPGGGSNGTSIHRR